MSESCAYVLWGSAGHAKVLAEIIVYNGGSVVALFDNKRVASSIPGVKIFYGEAGFRDWAENQGKLEGIFGLAAIGGSRGKDRLTIQTLFIENGLKVPILTHATAAISPSASLGAGTQVLAHANIAADAHLGRACIVNHNANVDHECVIGDGVHLAPSSTLCGCVSVGDNVLIGAGSVVLPRISIGANAVIGAGAVVTRNVPSGFTVVGNPAKPIKNIQ